MTVCRKGIQLIEARYRIPTRLTHGAFKTRNWNYKYHVVPPLSRSTNFRFGSASRGAKAFEEFANPKVNRFKRPAKWIYERLEEPVTRMLAERLALAEGGETAVTYATGMAAIHAAFGVTVKTGEEIISHKSIYACTYSLLTNWYPKYKIAVRFMDLRNLAAVKEAIRPETRAIFFETPANPTMELIDIVAVRKIVEEINRQRKEEEQIAMVVDNTFATPCCQQPLEMGADLVVHSLTKAISGFGTDMGGAIITFRKYESQLLLARKDFGGILSPSAAWSILVYGIPTLILRVREMQKNALEVAKFLEDHPKIKKVNYPGLKSFPQHDLARYQMRDYADNFAPGHMLYFVLKGRPHKAKRVGENLMDWLAQNSLAITLAVSLGQIRTLIEHPGSMTHSTVPADEQVKAGIDPGGIRMSMGIEDYRDIIGDLEKGLFYAYRR